MSTILDCPKCDGGPVIAWNTRAAKDENAIERQRYCKACGHDFRTVERPVAAK